MKTEKWSKRYDQSTGGDLVRLFRATVKVAASGRPQAKGVQ